MAATEDVSETDTETLKLMANITENASKTQFQKEGKFMFFIRTEHWPFLARGMGLGKMWIISPPQASLFLCLSATRFRLFFIPLFRPYDFFAYRPVIVSHSLTLSSYQPTRDINSKKVKTKLH